MYVKDGEVHLSTSWSVRSDTRGSTLASSVEFECFYQDLPASFLWFWHTDAGAHWKRFMALCWVVVVVVLALATRKLCPHLFTFIAPHLSRIPVSATICYPVLISWLFVQL